MFISLFIKYPALLEIETYLSAGIFPPYTVCYIENNSKG